MTQIEYVFSAEHDFFLGQSHEIIVHQMIPSDNSWWPLAKVAQSTCEVYRSSHRNGKRQAGDIVDAMADRFIKFECMQG